MKKFELKNYQLFGLLWLSLSIVFSMKASDFNEAIKNFVDVPILDFLGKFVMWIGNPLTFWGIFAVIMLYALFFDYLRQERPRKFNILFLFIAAAAIAIRFIVAGG